MNARLFVTDLDNTLWDWVTYFARAFGAMMQELVPLLGVSEAQLWEEFKAVHQRYRNSEQPFAALELESAKLRFGTSDRGELKKHLDPALRAFNRARRTHLRLYPLVESTLARLAGEGVRVVGHTEAMELNSYYRLRYFGLDGYLSRLYCPEGAWGAHPVAGQERLHEPPEGFVVATERGLRKPDTRILLSICDREGVAPAETLYVGDSLSRDIRMAVTAGARSVWARYGTQYDSRLWDLLVRITHWTEEDVAAEAALAQLPQLPPAYVIDGFEQVLDIIGLGPPARGQS